MRVSHGHKRYDYDFISYGVTSKTFSKQLSFYLWCSVGVLRDAGQCNDIGRDIKDTTE